MEGHSRSEILRAGKSSSSPTYAYLELLTEIIRIDDFNFYLLGAVEMSIKALDGRAKAWKESLVARGSREDHLQVNLVFTKKIFVIVTRNILTPMFILDCEKPWSGQHGPCKILFQNRWSGMDRPQRTSPRFSATQSCSKLPWHSFTSKYEVKQLVANRFNSTIRSWESSRISRAPDCRF